MKTRSQSGHRRMVLKLVPLIAATAAIAGSMATVNGAYAEAATTYTTSTTRVVASDDAYTLSVRRSLNTGSSERLVAGRTSGETKVSYLKFKVGTLATGAELTGAKLTLTRDDHHLPSTVKLSRVASTSWTESKLTAGNAPAVGSLLATVKPAATDISVTFDVSATVKAAGGYAFAVTSPATDDVARFRSTEYGSETAPKLTLTIRKPAPAPSPSTSPSASPTPSPTPSPTTAPSTPPTCEVSAKLVPSCGIWSGAAPGPFTGIAPEDALVDYEAKTGRTAGLFHVYHRGDELFPTASEIAKAREAGKPRKLFINWKVAWGTNWAAVARGEQDARIDKLAAYVKQNYPEKFFLAIHHEPENDVDQTAGSGMTATDYAAMYRHTVQRLRADGVDNAVFTMIYMGFEEWGKKAWFNDLYPGDDVVDWIGFDPYVNAKPGTYAYGDFSYLVNMTKDKAAWPGFYNWATTAHPSKPLIIAEWGVFEYAEDPSQKAWIYSTVAQQIGQFPAIKAMMYFNSPNAPKGDTRIDSSTSALDSFKLLTADKVLEVKIG